MRSLTSLQPGEEAVIASIEDDQIAPKLISMGVFPHARIKLLRKSFFDGILYLNTGSLRIALNKKEADAIIILP